MPQQQIAATQKAYSRRDFLKRAVLGAAAATAAALAAGKILSKGSKQTELPGPGSIFEPRRQALASHWRNRLGRFRLR